MRIIHTSDWHLGQHFMGKSREAEHRAFLTWLLCLIKETKADALVVAGDVFDTGTPPSYARAMYNEFIVALQQTGCSQAIILGGNHDSAATLNEAKTLLDCLNTKVVAGLSPEPEDHVLVLEKQDRSPGAILCAIPFIRPKDLVSSMAGQTGEDKQAALSGAITQFYQKVFKAAQKKQEQLKAIGPDSTAGGKDSNQQTKNMCPGDLPIIATGHLTVVGGKSSESVRDIYIGSLDAFAARHFPPVDYLALGHLHRSQIIKDQDHIRYSGSPIALSFDEGKIQKQVLKVDFKPGEPADITSVPIPCFRQLVSIKGDLACIEREISALGSLPDDNGDAGKGLPSSSLNIWLEVEVITDDYLSDLQERIQQMIQNGAGKDKGSMIELLRIRRKRKKNGQGLARAAKEKLEELTPNEVFLRRLAQEDIDPGEAEKLTWMFNQIAARASGDMG